MFGAACGAGTVEPSGVEPAVCAAGQIDGDLRIHVKGDILPPAAIPDFASRFGVEVAKSQYEARDELIAQVEARVDEYDLIIPDSATVAIMRTADLLIPLSPDAIPGSANLMALFTDPPYDPGSVHTVPYTWGTIGIGVNTNVAGDDVPPTWGLIFDPDISDRYTGRMSLVDDPRLAVGAALAYLGYSMNTEEATELEAAVSLLSEANSRLDGYTTLEEATELVNGATDVAQGPSAALFDAFEAADAWDDYTFVVPAEGAVLTADVMAIPITAAHPCTAHTFIDFLLDPKRGAEIAQWNRAASPNTAASELMPAELLGDAALYPPPETMENLQFVREVEDEVAYIDAFERARS